LPNALLWRGIEYVYTGDLTRGETLLRRAADVGLAHVGIGLHMVEAAHGRTAEAKQQLANGLHALAAGLAADAPAVVAAGVYGNAAEHAVAAALIEQVEAGQSGRISAFVPYSLLQLGESTRALSVVQQQLTSNDALFMHVIWSPAQRATRASPEFKAFTRKVGLVDLWDRYGPPDVCKRLAPGDYACD
jgi:hypothetical protein